MGKLLNSPEKSGGLPNQKNDNATNCERGGTMAHKTSGNILVYIILIVSLSFSAYTFLRQTHFENRIRHFQSLDKRIAIIEDKLRLFPLAFINSLAKTATIATTPDPAAPDIDLIADDTSTVTDTNADNGDEQFAHILQKLSLQVSGIQRLRRDVSHLKASRRGERQASVHPTDCSCPPGNNNSCIARCTLNYIKQNSTEVCSSTSTTTNNNK